MSYKRERRKSVFENPRFTIYEDDVIFPDGKTKGTYNVLEFPGKSVVSLAYKKDDVLMVESYRYPTDSVELELPAGGIENGETPAEAARRETKEETGYDTSNHKVIYEAQTSNGITNHSFIVVVSQIEERVNGFNVNEVKKVNMMKVDEIRNLIEEKKIKDAPTLVAFMLFSSHYSIAGN